MGLYDRYILPRLLDIAMRNREVARYRAELVPRARGEVLEIGIGSGLNLPFYGSAVERVVAVDPSEALLAMARRRAAAAHFPIELISQSAETLPLADQSIDVALTTFTLCTVADPVAALREVMRVLRPGGTLLFAEHGLAPDASVERWQHRLNPVWNRISGGCNLDRAIDTIIEAAGFEIADIERGYARGLRPMTYIYSGAARRN